MPYKYHPQRNNLFMKKSQKKSFKNNKQGQKYTNFKVVIRVRPPLNRELRNGYDIPTIQVSEDHKSCSLYEYYNMDCYEDSCYSDLNQK